jgi:uncharacterized protein YwqG
LVRCDGINFLAQNNLKKAKTSNELPKAGIMYAKAGFFYHSHDMSNTVATRLNDKINKDIFE